MNNVNHVRGFVAITSMLVIAACSNAPTTPNAPAALPAAPVAAVPPPPAAPPPILRYDDAVLSAATALFTNARFPADGANEPAHMLVIDPLIDGVTGQQSVTTRSMGERLATLVRQQYPQFALQPFSAASIARSPIVLIGTFTGVNAQRQTSGTREAYRICFALADLKTGKLVSKGLAFSLPEGVDSTPLASFRDAPAWTEDPTTVGYIRTCQGTKAGDPINPMYLDRIVAAAQVAEAIDAYDAGRYQQALDLYQGVSRTTAGDQFRVYNGLYLANMKLGRRADAEAAFGKIVDYGLARKRLAIKFLFRPGSTSFDSDSRVAAAYPQWVRTIATHTESATACLEVTGHTSPTGPEVLNERLSLLRAEYVKKQIESTSPALAKRTIANGVGSRQAMVGNGRDDASDALDRRVEFTVIDCGSSSRATT
jgi:outer membrane protein OmpA-like peptidoglycan-associated protein